MTIEMTETSGAPTASRALTEPDRVGSGCAGTRKVNFAVGRIEKGREL
jgi:hypothetical protein